MAFLLTMLAAALACGLEMVEALAIVLAVALTRRPRDALVGALGAVLVCGLLGVALGPLLTDSVARTPLRLVVGVVLLVFGLQWLRKAILRLAGKRSPSSAFREFVEEQEALERLAQPASGQVDWTGLTIAFKGVLLEGVEVIVIVTALGARPAGRAPALLGAGLALAATMLVGAVLQRPLRRLPETQLKYLVGLLLTSFGTFFAAEGLGVSWPLGAATLLALGATYLLASQAMVAWLARSPPTSAKSAKGGTDA